MDLDQLKQILELVREHELAEFEVEQDGFRLKIRKDAAGVLTPLTTLHTPGLPHLPVAAPGAPLAGAAAAVPPQSPSTDQSTDVDIELAVVKSPIVGTFYRSPEPGAAPFVEIGATVKKG